ncbi:NAD-dependent epimerase/dehydratase family protein [Kutzneria sp. CA-103260]|uniref:NAD-dependent epimerase/dehydratase family protein n=1 Tax=Kutzneria sp. CA-103260 TaxID=2802641 RepID=UPI001BA50513|nr:NAD-dependent epimerase/dehydratase family protein [Kutzneria sp. CA-103260]QUQ67524.1 NAD-dependent epimerase/dehydratase [Kutzneria sp. CA-103260]
MRLAVTGATGFVGGEVCRAAVAAGWEVHAFSRRPATVPGATYQSWDLNGTPPALSDVDAVVHCAAAATDAGRPSEVWAANVAGTRRVLDAFPHARIVHVSSASVYDPFRPAVRATEAEAPVPRYLNAYGASKAAAERIVLAARRDTVILRPHAVYGPGDTTLVPRLLENIRAGRLLVPGDGRALLSMTAVGNLAQACLLAARSTPTGVFNIADSDTLSIDQALRGLLAAADVDATPVYLPTRLVWPLAAGLEAVQRFSGRPRRIRLNRYVISQLAMERTLDIGAAVDRLGYAPTPTMFTYGERTRQSP